MKDIKKFIKEFKIGTKTMFKEFFNKKTNKKQIANMLTFSRLFIAPIIPILMILGVPIGALIAAILGESTDWFDGKIARMTNSTSKYGELLDPVLDKFFSFIVGISLCLSNPMFLLNIIGEGLIAGTNIGYQFKYKDLKIKSSKLGKFKQWPLTATFVLGFIAAKFPVLNIATNTAIINMFALQLATLENYIKKNEQELKKMEENKDIQIIDIHETNENLSKQLEKRPSSINNNEKRSRQDQIDKLKNIRDEIINSKNKEKDDSNEKQKKIN